MRANPKTGWFYDTVFLPLRQSEVDETKSTFDQAGVSGQKTCTICGGMTHVLRRKFRDVQKNTSWENESTMKLLGLTSVESQVRLCLRCLHFFRFPLFDERLIYGERGVSYRKEAYEKYFPGRFYERPKNSYQQGWFIQNTEVFAFFAHVFSLLARGFPKTGPKKENPKLLDWGGGDGYFVETISLISKKVLNLNCKTYCFDYHKWPTDAPSPYFRHINYKGLEREAPFDIIFLLHVLEHVPFPKDLIKNCSKYLSNNGMLIVAVPYDLPYVLFSRYCQMHYHQNLFSITSLTEVLRRSCFGNIHVKLFEDCSYRGQKSRIILASTCVNGAKPRIKTGNYLVDAFNFPKVMAGMMCERIQKILDRLTASAS